MKKIVLLIISILLITGCSVKYKVTINDDLSIQEEAKLTGTSTFFNNYYKTTKINVLKSLLDIYKDTLDNNNYTYELIEDKTPYINVTKKYDNPSDFVNSSILFNGYFDEVKYLEDGNIKKIETIGYNENDPDNPERFVIKELEIAIKCPYKVTNHNAKDVDKETNTYYYDLNEENKILLEYDISSKFNPNSDLIRTLIILVAILIATWFIVFILNKNKNK